jgi:hypothetical protein
MNIEDMFSNVTVVSTTDDGKSNVTKLGGLDELLSFFDNEVKKLEDKKKPQEEEKSTKEVLRDVIDKNKAKLPKHLSDKIDTIIDKIQKEYNEKIDTKLIKDTISILNGDNSNLFKVKVQDSDRQNVTMEMNEDVVLKINNASAEPYYMIDGKSSIGHSGSSCNCGGGVHTPKIPKFTQAVTKESSERGLKTNGEKETMGAIYFLVHHIFADPSNYHGSNFIEYTNNRFKIIEKLLNTQLDYNSVVWTHFDISHIESNGEYNYTQLDWKGIYGNNTEFVKVDFSSNEFIKWINNAYDVAYYINLFHKRKSEYLNSTIQGLDKSLYTLEDYVELTKEQKSKIKKQFRNLLDEQRGFEIALDKIPHRA